MLLFVSHFYDIFISNKQLIFVCGAYFNEIIVRNIIIPSTSSYVVSRSIVIVIKIVMVIVIVIVIVVTWCNHNVALVPW